LFLVTAGFSPVAGLKPSRGGRLLKGDDGLADAVVARSMVALMRTLPRARAW
jgi:hypothetical protein